MGKTPSDLAHEIAQECISKAPVLILGSGVSAAHGIPGMPGLYNQLLTTSPPAVASSEEAAGWGKFLEKLNTTDLESALTVVRLLDRLTRHIVETTWEYLVPFDLHVFEALVRNRSTLSLTQL